MVLTATRAQELPSDAVVLRIILKYSHKILTAPDGYARRGGRCGGDNRSWCWGKCNCRGVRLREIGERPGRQGNGSRRWEVGWGRIGNWDTRSAENCREPAAREATATRSTQPPNYTTLAIAVGNHRGQCQFLSQLQRGSFRGNTHRKSR